MGLKNLNLNIANMGNAISFTDSIELVDFNNKDRISRWEKRYNILRKNYIIHTFGFHLHFVQKD